MRDRTGASPSSDTTPRDVLSWAALTAALVVTASGEYELGRHAGFAPWLAAGIPASLDVYALRAMKAQRDVGLVVGAMIVVNALSHLVSTGLIPVSIPLVVAVSAIAPLVFWRVHKLRHDAASDRQETPELPASSTPLAGQERPAPGRQELGQDIGQDGAPQPTVGDAPARQEPPAAGGQNAARKPRKPAAKKRRSMDEWVEIGTPVFHNQFALLKRPPSGTEFAKALADAGHGKPSASTAKNIKTEILDRAPLPSLEDQ